MAAPKPRIRTVLFDLDGTLLDTAPDLAYALNQTLLETGRQPLPFERIRPQVSHGARALVELGFGLPSADAAYGTFREHLLANYRANLARETRLFPGMQTVLDTIGQQGLNWGVVTNKPSWLTEPLMDEIRLAPPAICVVSGDTTGNSKPDPEPLLYACQLAGSPPGACLYVGDAPRDIEAGRNAGLHTVVALYGYIGPNDAPDAWGADDRIERPEELLAWLPDGDTPAVP